MAVAAALYAYSMWGILPLLFWAMRGTSSLQILAHRVVWGLFFLGGIVLWNKRTATLVETFRNPRLLVRLMLSAILIASNWLLFIMTVEHRHVLDASLGYFINPLVNVLFGVALLGERLRPLQGVAVAMAAVGVVVLAVDGGGGSWIAIALAVTFSLYGLVRKLIPVPAIEGLVVETVLLFPFALAFLVLPGTASWMWDLPAMTGLLLLVTGPFTALPLLFFTYAAQRMPYSTLGLFQYISPSMQFVLALTVFGESFRPLHAAVFGLIWAGLALYVYDSRRARSRFLA